MPGNQKPPQPQAPGHPDGEHHPRAALPPAQPPGGDGPGPHPQHQGGRGKRAPVDRRDSPPTWRGAAISGRCFLRRSCSRSSLLFGQHGRPGRSCSADRRDLLRPARLLHGRSSTTAARRSWRKERQAQQAAEGKPSRPGLDVRMFTVGPVAENAFIFRRDGADRALIVDPGDEATACSARSTSSGSSVDAILLTHTHFDHVGAVAPMANETGAPVYCPEIEVPVLADIMSFVPWPGFGPFESYDADETSPAASGSSSPASRSTSSSPPATAPGTSPTRRRPRPATVQRRRPLPGLGRPHRPAGRRLADAGRGLRMLVEGHPHETTVYPGHMGITTLGAERARTRSCAISLQRRVTSRRPPPRPAQHRYSARRRWTRRSSRISRRRSIRSMPSPTRRLASSGACRTRTATPPRSAPSTSELMIVNMSVWESIEALRAFAYSSARAQGGPAPAARMVRAASSRILVLWWIPAGHIPTVEEAKERLELLARARPDRPSVHVSRAVRPADAATKVKSHGSGAPPGTEGNLRRPARSGARAGARLRAWGRDPRRGRLRPDRDAHVRGDVAVRARRGGVHRHRQQGDVHLHRPGGPVDDPRPEGTAPSARAYVEHGMHKLPQPVRLWYWGPYFRYERPAEGPLPPVQPDRRRDDRHRQARRRRGADRPARRAAAGAGDRRRRAAPLSLGTPASRRGLPRASCAPTCASTRPSSPTTSASGSTRTRCAPSTPTTREPGR